MYLAIFTITHVAISLIGIASGFVVLRGFLTGKRHDNWTHVFLVTTVATSVTGFLFPVDRFLPSHAFGIVSLIALGVGLYAYYNRGLTGLWRSTFVATSVFAQYLNVFVFVVQTFLKVPTLKALAPTQSELPFAATQFVVLIAFLAIGIVAVRRERTSQHDGELPVGAFCEGEMFHFGVKVDGAKNVRV